MADAPEPSSSNPEAAAAPLALPNELSAPYEVPHFPIEKIETKKLQYVSIYTIFICSSFPLIWTVSTKLTKQRITLHFYNFRVKDGDKQKSGPKPKVS